MNESTEMEALCEELAEARAELERIYEDRLPERIAHFGPKHGEPIERLQLTTASDGDILSVVEQQGRLWLEVMRLRGQQSHRTASLYLTPNEAKVLRDVLQKFVETSRG